MRVDRPERFAPGDLIEIVDKVGALSDLNDGAIHGGRPKARSGTLRVLTEVDNELGELLWYHQTKSGSDVFHAPLLRNVRVEGPGDPWAWVRRWEDIVTIDPTTPVTV